MKVIDTNKLMNKNSNAKTTQKQRQAKSDKGSERSASPTTEYHKVEPNLKESASKMDGNIDQ